MSVKQMIEKVIEIHYGIRAGLIGELLMESALSEILKRFRSLTVQDIEYAFERAKIERDDNWRNVTKKMIIDPIEIWWNKKEGIGLDYIKHKDKFNEEQEGIDREKKFKSESIVVYAHSLKQKEWLGDIFQAAIAAPLLKDHIDQADKDEIWWRACHDYRIQEEAYKYASVLGGKIEIKDTSRTEFRIYCERIVKFGIALNIPL